MADDNRRLITRAELNSTINDATGRAALTFDGKTADLASFTGIRDITGLLTSGQVTSGRLLIARAGFQVLWIFDNLRLPAGAEGLNWQIAAGTALQAFRPFYTTTKNYLTGSGGRVVRLAVNRDANVYVQFAQANVGISTVLETFTQASWPTTLPGVVDGQPVVL